MSNVSPRKRNVITTRTSRAAVLADRKMEKKRLKKSLEWGDAAHIHSQMNATGEPISYLSVINTLNVNSQFYSPRVIEFAKKYIKETKLISKKR